MLEFNQIHPTHHDMLADASKPLMLMSLIQLRDEELADFPWKSTGETTLELTRFGGRPLS